MAKVHVLLDAVAVDFDGACSSLPFEHWHVDAVVANVLFAAGSFKDTIVEAAASPALLVMLLAATQADGGSANLPGFDATVWWALAH